MAVNSYDPVDGHPIFLDSDAPDIKVDPTKAAEYAGFMGGRVRRPAAERLAYAYPHEGLEWYETDTGDTYTYRAGNWVLTDRPLTAWTPTLTGLTLGTGGTALARYRVSDRVVTYWVRITLGTGAAATGTIYASTPITADTTYNDIGTFTALGPSGSRAVGTVGLDNPGRTWFLASSNNFLSLTQPWSWGGGNEIRFNAQYILA